MGLNIKGGIDRISFVLAVISIIPGIYWGVHSYEARERDEGIRMFRESGGLLSQSFYAPKKNAKYYAKLVESGVGCGGGSFLLVLLGIRGTTRLFLWIIAGFKEEKSKIKKEKPKRQQPLTGKAAIWKWIVTGEIEEEKSEQGTKMPPTKIPSRVKREITKAFKKSLGKKKE